MAETGAAAQRVMARLSEKGWSRAALAREAGVDPATITDFLNGKRWPILATLGRIEAALSLTPGTLAALGEESQPAGPPVGQTSELTDAELLAEVGYRLTRLQRENAKLRRQLNEAEEMADRLQSTMADAQLIRDLGFDPNETSLYEALVESGQIDPREGRDSARNVNNDDAIERYFGELDDEVGPGRPSMGDAPAISVKIPVDMLAAIDAAAAKADVARAEWIRRACQAAFGLEWVASPLRRGSSLVRWGCLAPHFVSGDDKTGPRSVRTEGQFQLSGISG